MLRNGNLFKTIVLLLLAGLASLIVQYNERNVYSKEVIDAKFHGIEWQLTNIESDIQWLVRRGGGTPHVETREDNHTPQPD